MEHEVIKVLAAFESAGEQLAQHPTTGLFYITDHVKTSVPALVFRAQNLQQQRQGYQLSCEQAADATATLDKLAESGNIFCNTTQNQVDQAFQACEQLPAPASSSTSISSTRDYVTKLPQLLSSSRLNLTWKSSSSSSKT